MANHHASTYHDVKNVPMIVSPLFKVPTPISPPYDMHPLPDDITQRRYHDFALERKIVTAYQRMVAEESAAMEAKEIAYRVYSEERQARLKQERISRARKIAPGFLDNEDRRILTPTLATAQFAPQRSVPLSNKTTSQFDFSEFETNDGSSDNTSPVSAAKADEVSSHSESRLDQQQRDSPPREVCLSPTPEDILDPAKDGIEEEVIVQAVPLSELTGMLRESCLEDDSASNSTPRPWTGRDTTPEKSTLTLPAFNTRLDYREFEQGLGPPDPWDTPVDDLTALKDVMSQQIGQNNGSSHSTQHDPSLQNRNFSQKLQQQQSSALQQQHQATYPYQQTQASSQSYQADTTLQHGQYSYGTNNVSRPSAGTSQQYNSSPIPVPAYVDQKQQHQGLSSTPQQHQQHPHHQQHQQHRHSTGGVGAHPSTGLTVSQQHARFGNASPSPPPLPPPPRAMTSSPSGTGTGAGTPTLAVSRPPLPARPGRPTDLDSQSVSSPAPDHITVSVTERSMTPPRPPLPPAPAPLSSSPSTSSSGPSTVAGLRPALKPKPPKEFATTGGMNVFTSGGGGAATDMDRSMSGNSSGGISGSEDMQQQAAHLAPPQASALIEQLASMGFTREQSREALEKYDYDPTKALNHLLDWG